MCCQLIYANMFLVVAYKPFTINLTIFLCAFLSVEMVTKWEWWLYRWKWMRIFHQTKINFYDMFLSYSCQAISPFKALESWYSQTFWNCWQSEFCNTTEPHHFMNEFLVTSFLSFSCAHVPVPKGMQTAPGTSQWSSVLLVWWSIVL